MIPLTEDKLKREKFLNDLFRMFENFGNHNGHGLTMVINGKYGSGKSTLLGFIEEQNAVDNKFDIIKYDAWENNFFENPMMPILYTISKLEKTGSKIKETAKNIVKNIPKAILSTLTGAHSVDLQPLFNNENIFDDYDNYKNAITKFKEVLTSHCANKKTVLLVDELDRCLPEYQIKVLEALYHLLDIPNLIVVIALDKDQLETSIQAKFGKELNSHGYLSKFIQYEIDLPEGDTYSYIISLMQFNVLHYSEYDIKLKLAEVFKAINLPIRECILIIEKLNLLFGSNSQCLYFIPIMTATLLILKHIDYKTYKKFFVKNREYINNGITSVDLQNSPFGLFLEEVKDTEFEKIFKHWLSDDGYGHSLMLHFIELFYPLSKITTESLGKFFNTDPSNIEARFRDRDNWNYPHTANKLINAINNII